LRTIGKVSAKVTGTRIKWWADRQIFLKEAALDIEEVYARARQTSFLVPGLTLIVNDNRTKAATTQTFYHKGGISEFCEFCNQMNQLAK
jgi:DNA gyrase subunit B